MIYHLTAPGAMPQGHTWLAITLPDGITHLFATSLAAMAHGHASMARTPSPAVSASV